MEMNFCRRCGAPLHPSENHVYTCQNGHVIFANASPAAGLLVINDKNEVLIAIRAHDPGKGMFDIPGGFCDGAETFEVSLKRELQEEVGLTATDYTTPEYILSGIDKYEYKGEKIDVLGAVYWARLIGSPTLHPQDDVAEAIFIPVGEINPEKIYFDAVRNAFLILRDKLL